MRYEARFLLGGGAMGEVWVGMQRGPHGFERPVVLKRARAAIPLPGELDPEEALVRESHLLSLIAHPNVVRLIDLAKTPDGLVLVLELIRGVSLRRWLEALDDEGRRLDAGFAARLIADVALGLDATHRAADLDGRAADIVHRDVNPENLMVSEHGLVKLLDFGVARTALRERTRVPVIKGKLPYLSPEQVEGRELDWRSDVFALGAVLFELVTGRRLFAGEDATAVLDAIAEARTASLPDPCPDPMRAMFDRMTALDPRARPSFAEVATALDAIASAAGVSHGTVASALRRDMGSALDGLRARLRGLPEGSTTELETPVARALDAFATSGDATLPDAPATKELPR
ncbi:MAG: serine/threonine-protein kinase [Sandaracinaceae bacterium]